MGRKRIVVLGASSGGYTAALALKDLVRLKHDVTLIARSDQFVFAQSLGKLALGERSEAQTACSVRRTLGERGIAFRAETALKLDLARRRVVTAATEERYDALVIATGARPNYSAVPGLGPRGYTHSISTLTQAQLARTAFRTFLTKRGPIVIGDVQGAFARSQGRALVADVARVLRSSGFADVPITHLSAGPASPGDGFGAIGEAPVAEITPGEIRLLDGRRLPFALSILLPPHLGVDLVRACPAITDAAGFVQLNPFQQTHTHPEVFGAGAAVALDEGQHSGESFERRALLAAENVAAFLGGGALAPFVERPADPGWEDRALARYFPSSGDK